MSEISNFKATNASIYNIKATHKTPKQAKDNKKVTNKQKKKHQKQANFAFFTAITEIFP